MVQDTPDRPSWGRRFIQFPHPGNEHRPDRRSDRRAWNSYRYQHARKFVEVNGAWSDGVSKESGPLWAWAEWEPESDVIRTLDQSSPDRPRYLWRPYWVRKDDYTGLHNTDPFIYGGFYYTDCKQAESAALEGLRRLDRGSVLVFGSFRGGAWVLDTVLVVQDFIDHDADTHRARLAGRVPDCYEDVVLKTTYQSPEKSARRLYLGAEESRPLDGMFSFFPCLPASGGRTFARPLITLPEDYFTIDLRQGAKGHARGASSVDRETIRGLWDSIVEQVLAQGLMLGIAADVPPERSS